MRRTTNMLKPLLRGGGIALVVALVSLTLAGESWSQLPQILFFDDFESGPGKWAIPGSMIITADSGYQSPHSQTFGSVVSGGDARTLIFAVNPGQTYYQHVAYMTRGGGGYIGVDRFDASMTFVGEQWLIGDGAFPTPSMWDYNVFNTNPANLGVWRVYSQAYVIPANVRFVRIKTEDWEGGLPNAPLTAGVFFDNIEWSTSPTPSYLKTIVTIDIKPGDFPNSINLASHGYVPVAILTTSTFDASTVAVNTIRFAGAAPERSAFEDVDGDGDLDLVLHFDTQALDLTCASTQATLVGQTSSGKTIEGTDTVRIVRGKAGRCP